MIEEVLLRVRGRQCFYIRTKPIHPSQQIVEEDAAGDGCMTISLQLIPNYELRSMLMSHGPDVEVLSPKSLRDEMAALYRRGAEYYAS